MAGAGKQSSIRAMGIYLILLLVLLRFLIYPLCNGLERQKQILDEQKKSLSLKTRLLNQQQGGAPLASFVGREQLTPYLYEKEQSLTGIQLDIVHRMNVLAREKGGELVRFEMLETIPGRTLSEAPVTLWFSGPPQALMNILRAVESTGKSLDVKGMEITKSPQEYLLTLTLSAYRLER